MKKILSIVLALVLMVSCFAIASVSAAETYTYAAYNTTTSSSPMKYTITSGKATMVDRSSYNGYDCKQITSGTYSITFSVDNLPAGEYDVSFAHISQTAQYRGVFDISVNGGAAQTVDFASTGAKRIDVTLDAKAVSNGVDANTVTFTVNPDVVRAENQMFLYTITFTPTGEVGETVATESTTTTTTTTTTQAPIPDDTDSYSYVVYDNMSDNMNAGTGTAKTETDNMVITVNGGLLTKRDDNYIAGYNFAQWGNSSNNKKLTFELKNVPAGEYTLTLNTADNNSARGSFDVVANDVSLGEVNCLNKTGKKLTEHALATTFTANGVDNVIVSITPSATTTEKQIFLYSIVLTKVGEWVETDGETTDLISTVDGASIRLNEVNGMRFYATVDANLDLETVTEMGIIIAPKDIVGDYFTMEDDHIKVPYNFKDNALWDGNQFVGSIVELKNTNLARNFIARAYVVIDGVTYYAKEATVRNLAAIADEYIADANGGYAELDEATKALVDTWAKAND